MSNRSAPQHTWLLNSVIVSILVAWVVNFTARLFIPTYEPPQGLDALMLAVVGFLFAGRQSAKGQGDGDGDADRPDRDRGDT
ncbi:membrane protein [Gordonia phage Clawz]|uniref:Membrane protein n=1 Tax=Gordonia phage Clawz TaxID=2743910 RepID=A0AAE7K693_9CAUD|nr:membrane protein [Gordonia phage Clawz]QKY79959.1 membrane protein [Gordonia phage Clawz]